MLMFKQAVMQSLLALQCFAVLCSLSAYFRLALLGWLYRLFFLSFISPLVFKQQQGVSASAGRSDELTEGIKLGVKFRIDCDSMVAPKKLVVDEPRELTESF